MPEVLDAPLKLGCVKPTIDPAIRAQVRTMIRDQRIPVSSTARTLNLSENTVRAWTRKEGWLTQTHSAPNTSPKANTLKLVAGTVTKIPNARGESTRRKLASSVDKLADAVDSQDVSEPKSLKTVASAVKSLVDSAKVIHGWSEADNSTYAFAAVMGEVVRGADGPERPAIDVEGKPSQGS